MTAIEIPLGVLDPKKFEKLPESLKADKRALNATQLLLLQAAFSK
jgi:hypothetical protein